MPEPKIAQCSKCSPAGEVTPATLFCWRHQDSPPKVGEFFAEGGQLMWRSTAACSGKAERALAVLLDGAQTAVRQVGERTSARPARLDLTLGDAVTNTGAAPEAWVSLAALLEAVLAGYEYIEATRHP